MVGDTVSDSAQRTGMVMHIIHVGSETPELVIEWNDATIGIRFWPDDLMLIERA
jgi:hypothetical protein